MWGSHQPATVRINQEKLAERLGIRVDEVSGRLIRNGFTPDYGCWYVNAQLSLLRPDEIIEQWERRTEGNITFVERIIPAMRT